MPIRVVRLHPRHPLAGALLAVVVLLLLAVVLTLGLTLAAGAAAVGGVVLLARRAFGRRMPARPLPLDPANEVFSPTSVDASHRLPPGAS